MTTDPSMPVNLVNVHGTQLLVSDTRERYREKLARITLDSMVQFVGLLDAKGTVLEINQVALDAVGIKLSDVEGKPFWTTFWWQVSEEINATLRESIARAAQGEFVRWDTPIYGRAGGKETIIIDASLMPVMDDQGMVVFITAEGRDITEKKAHEREIARQREELAQLDQLKTQFFANISHEFRTPLTLMMGPLEDALADAEGVSADNRDHLELAHRNSLRLLKLVNTLLDFSRLEAGRIEASYEPTDLAALTADLASVFRSAIERAGMRLIVDCPPLSETVYVDREMWEKVVLNLLSNAFKFTFEGEIALSLRRVDSAVQLSIVDTGTGIPVDEIPRLFERFHRVKGARGRSYEGSGIGLALVQELVKLHGGSVGIESEVGRGSVFTVTIPLGTAHLPTDRIEAARTLTSTGLRSEAFLEEILRWLPDERRTVPTSPSESLPDHGLEELHRNPVGWRPDGGLAGQRILLADDNADMREYVRRLLNGYEVETVADGVAALHAARERTPDLVLTDVMMPAMDGFELLRELRADPRTREVPVILLSARAGEESRIEGLEAGADDYLIKPFSAREVVARVQSHLALAKLRRESQEALRQREEHLRAVVDTTPACIKVVAADGTLLDMNAAGLAMVDADCLEQIRGKSVYGLICQEDLDAFRAFNERICRGEKGSLAFEIMGLRGTKRRVETYAAPLRGPDGGFCQLAITQDITERKRGEDAREAALREKEVLLKEIHHRVKNNLQVVASLLSLQSSAVQHPAVHTFVQESERRIQAMALVHETLYQGSDLGEVSMAAYLQTLTARLVRAYSVEIDRIHVHIEVDEVALPLDMAVPCGLILSELVSNCLKHAFPNGQAGEVTVTLVREGDRVRLTVRDNGCGVPAPFDIRETESLGLQLVWTLTEQLQGTMSLARDEGAAFTVTFPLPGA